MSQNLNYPKDFIVFRLGIKVKKAKKKQKNKTKQNKKQRTVILELTTILKLFYRILIHLERKRSIATNQQRRKKKKITKRKVKSHMRIPPIKFRLDVSAKERVLK